MEHQIVIFGAGGFGREVLQIIRDINAVKPTWHCVGFIVDEGFESNSMVAGLPILGNVNWLQTNPQVQVVVAVGSSAARMRITKRIQDQCTNKFATLIHPLAWIGENVEIGHGSIICAGALITTDITIGEHVHVNIGATIGHDAKLKNFVTLNPRVSVSGNVGLLDGSEIGTGSVVIPSCIVGPWSIVGAGSVVTRQVKENATVVGAPARVVKERPNGWQLS